MIEMGEWTSAAVGLIIEEIDKEEAFSTPVEDRPSFPGLWTEFDTDMKS